MAEQPTPAEAEDARTLLIVEDNDRFAETTDSAAPIGKAAAA